MIKQEAVFLRKDLHPDYQFLVVRLFGNTTASVCQAVQGTVVEFHLLRIEARQIRKLCVIMDWQLVESDTVFFDNLALYEFTPRLTESKAESIQTAIFGIHPQGTLQSASSFR